MADADGLQLYTLGHGNRSATEFVGLLHAHGIQTIADVRAQPASRRHPHFSRTVLAPLLFEAGIRYVWLGAALGGFRSPGSYTRHVALASPSLRGYADHMSSAEFHAGAQRLLAEAETKPTALLCAERQAQDCHRLLIADYLTTHGVSVLHLVDAATAVPHRLSISARLTADGLIYDRGITPQLLLDY